MSMYFTIGYGDLNVERLLEEINGLLKQIGTNSVLEIVESEHAFYIQNRNLSDPTDKFLWGFAYDPDDMKDHLYTYWNALLHVVVTQQLDEHRKSLNEGGQ